MFDKDFENNVNITIAKNLNKYLDLNGMSQADLARMMKVSTATTSNWCKGIKLPRMDKIDKICSIFGINRSDLMDEKDSSQDKTSIKGVRIPVLGYVRAGVPLDAVEEILDFEEIHPDMAATADYFALRVKGDSMEPRITEGDVVIVREQPDVESGEIAIVLVNGDEGTVKKLVKYENGSIALVAFNSAYQPMVFTPEQIETLPVQVIGKVVELRGKF